MENPRITKRGVEENTLAILDSSGVKDAGDIHDDRLAFLEAVRGASLVSESSTVPTRKMYDAVFRIFSDDGSSLELLLACYQLLTELDQRYPRVFLAITDEKVGTHDGGGDLVVVEEAWLPFVIGLENANADGEDISRNQHDLIDVNRFSLLIENIEATCDADAKSNIKSLKEMLLFQYLINVVAADFIPRQTVYKKTLNWVIVRESLLNMLLCSRRLSFKALSRNCIAVLCKRSQILNTVSLRDLKCAGGLNPQTEHNCDVALAVARSETGRSTCAVMENFLTLVMELDVIKKEAEVLGCTSRADGVRTPLLEIILDELTYDKDLVSPFLEAFSEPTWKLEMTLQYFWKYCSKPSVRTRQSNKSSDVATLEGVLDHLSNPTSVKNLIRKVTAEVAQLLLAHAFQAYLSLHPGLKIVFNDGESSSSSLVLLCQGILSAFKNLKKGLGGADTLPFVNASIFTASTILSMQS